MGCHTDSRHVCSHSIFGSILVLKHTVCMPFPQLLLRNPSQRDTKRGNPLRRAREPAAARGVQVPWGGGGAAGPPPVRPCEREGSAPESARPGAPGDAGARHPSAPASPGPRPAHTAGKPGGKELGEQTRDARQRARERRPLRTCQKGPVCTGPGRLHRAPGGSAWEERAWEERAGRSGCGPGRRSKVPSGFPQRPW